MLVIGFGHRARQGKNTAALAMLNSMPLDTHVIQYAFGDALRSEVRVACAKYGGQHALITAWKQSGLMPEWVICENAKPRTLLQWWGTDFRRAKDPEYWVKRLKTTLDNHNPDVALITDVRFPNELDAIRAWGGVYVEVVNTGDTDIDVHGHPSEAALDGVRADYWIVAGSRDECEEKAAGLFRQIVRDHASCLVSQ